MRTVLFQIAAFALLASCNAPKDAGEDILLEKTWKMHSGDNLAWATPEFNDSEWSIIDPYSRGTTPEEFKEAYAWYRISFTLPKNLLENAYFGEEIQISPGIFQASEQTFLNGYLLGQNNILNIDPDAPPAKMESDTANYPYNRNYVISVNDSRLQWGKLNYIAIRVQVSQGGENLVPEPSVSLVDIKDYFNLNVTSEPFILNGDNYIKTIRLINSHPSETFSGNLIIKVSSNYASSEIYKSTIALVIPPQSEKDHMFTFNAPQSESYKTEYIFVINGSHFPIYQLQGTPYILSPPTPVEPHINGRDIYIFQAGHPIFLPLPVSGAHPITITAEGLPEELSLDSKSGIISGSLKKSGSYQIKVKASNSLGKDLKNIRIIVENQDQFSAQSTWKNWNFLILNMTADNNECTATANSELHNFGWSFIEHGRSTEADTFSSLSWLNDPKIKELGWGEWEEKIQSSLLFADEQYALVSLSCLLGTPLKISNKLSNIDDFTFSLLTNREVLAVNQDALDHQADLVYQKDSIQLWMKPMDDGTKVIGFFNMDKKRQKVTIHFNEIKLAGRYAVRDLWRQKDIGEVSDEISVDIYPHGVYLVRLSER